MCKTRFSQSSTMVTPTKSKQYYHQRPQGKFSQSPMTTPPRNYRKSTPSPTSDGFKTPQNPRFSPGSNPKTLASRCASEPIKSKKKQPQQQQQAQVTHRTSPLTFAGAKCLDPPTASSLPRPPTTWTKQETTFSAKQVLSFEDLVQTQKNSQNPDLDPLSQQLRMLLKVQAWKNRKHESKQRIFSPWMAVIIQESLENNFFEFWRPTILMIITERKKKQFWTQPPFAFQN